MSNKNLSLGLIGANGRLGSAIACMPYSGITIEQLFTRQQPAKALAEIDVYLDVSTSDALEANVLCALQAEKPIVIGTTGHKSLNVLEKASKKIPIFYSANFSLGAALLCRAAGRLAQEFGEKTSIRIVETHHAQKKDAPSGTSLWIAKTMEQHCAEPVPIQSIREANVPGVHEVLFSSFEETLFLRHEATSIKTFARGALEATTFLALQPAGFYTMDDLIRSYLEKR